MSSFRGAAYKNELNDFSLDMYYLIEYKSGKWFHSFL